MLVLGLKTGDVVHIGEDVDLVVVEIEAGVVRLGFTAPRDIPILRADAILKQPRAMR